MSSGTADGVCKEDTRQTRHDHLTIYEFTVSERVPPLDSINSAPLQAR